jgi:ribosomal protein L12E/L44/L45/RPP1/RPP2
VLAALVHGCCCDLEAINNRVARSTQAENITTITKAAGIEVEPYWPGLFAKLVEKKPIEDFIVNVGAGGGAPAAAAAPAAGGAAAAAEEKKEEKVEEEEDEVRGRHCSETVNSAAVHRRRLLLCTAWPPFGCRGSGGVGPLCTVAAHCQALLSSPPCRTWASPCSTEQAPGAAGLAGGALPSLPTFCVACAA